MDYFVALRAGQNDVKALLSLEPVRRVRVAPILSVRGDTSKDIDKFVAGWGDLPFVVDVSHYSSDEKSAFIANNGLHDTASGYASRRSFYSNLAAKNPKLIPTISWNDGDSEREIIQFALALSQTHEQIALRPSMLLNGKSPQWSTTLNVLNAIPQPQKLWLTPDFGYFDLALQPGLAAKTKTIAKFSATLGLAGVSFIATSYPNAKPASGSTATAPCLDPGVYLQTKLGSGGLKLIYADCGATNPGASMDYIVGMPIIPFAAYFSPLEWWQGRLGKTHENEKFVDLAQMIRALPGYHQDSFCWGTKEIARIASGTSTTGSNGSWNGIRINQHICGILDHMDKGGFTPGSVSDAADDE